MKSHTHSSVANCPNYVQDHTPLLAVSLVLSNLEHFLDFHGQDILKDSMTGICRVSLHLDLSKVSSILFRGWSRARMPQK